MFKFKYLVEIITVFETANYDVLAVELGTYE